MNEEPIILYLIHNQGFLKELAAPLTDQKNTALKYIDSCFHKEVIDQYESVLRRQFAVQIKKALGAPADDVMIVLEALNLKEYLNI